MNRIYGTDGNAYETSISNGKEYMSLKKKEEDFAIEELKKIKRKLILKLNEKFDFGITEALNIIDEELSELKGE